MEPYEFRPDNYGPVCAELLSSDDLPPLGPGTPQQAPGDRLRSLTINQLFPGATIRDRSMARCCLAGLWLWFDCLAESHEISQQISGASGSYWHGIMHRREPDYGNAKYWFRQVGEHPIHAPLALLAATIAAPSAAGVPTGTIGGAGWDPIAFVDLCQRHEGEASSTETCLRRIARVEWQLLFDYCYRQASA